MKGRGMPLTVALQHAPGRHIERGGAQAAPAPERRFGRLRASRPHRPRRRRLWPWQRPVAPGLRRRLSSLRRRRRPRCLRLGNHKQLRTAMALPDERVREHKHGHAVEQGWRRTIAGSLVNLERRYYLCNDGIADEHYV